MSNKKYKKNIITNYINTKIGTSIRYLSKKYNISEFKIYNFCKGLSRSNEVELLMLDIGVPAKLIDKTFEDKKK